jgi:hypothetical protein
MGSMPSVSKKRHSAVPYDKILRQVPEVFLFLLLKRHYQKLYLDEAEQDLF